MAFAVVSIGGGRTTATAGINEDDKDDGEEGEVVTGFLLGRKSPTGALIKGAGPDLCWGNTKLKRLEGFKIIGL